MEKNDEEDYLCTTKLLFLQVTKVGDEEMKGVYFFLKQGCLFAMLHIIHTEKHTKLFLLYPFIKLYH